MSRCHVPFGLRPTRDRRPNRGLRLGLHLGDVLEAGFVDYDFLEHRGRDAEAVDPDFRFLMAMSA